MQKLVYWSYPTWLMSRGHKWWHGVPTTGKLRISSEIHLQPAWTTQTTFDVPQVVSPGASLISRAPPRHFISFPTACDAEPLWGAALHQWCPSSLTHSYSEVGWGDRKTEFGNRELEDLASWSQVLQCPDSIGQGRWEKGSSSAWEALYFPSLATAAPICSSPIHLTHHQSWFLHVFFPHLSLY